MLQNCLFIVNNNFNNYVINLFRTWPQVLRKGRQFRLHWCHPSCYSVLHIHRYLLGLDKTYIFYQSIFVGSSCQCWIVSHVQLLPYWSIKWRKKTKKTHNVRTVLLKYKRNTVEIGKIETPNTYTWPLTFHAWYRHCNKKWRG